jgi:hypothetical protein
MVRLVMRAIVFAAITAAAAPPVRAEVVVEPPAVRLCPRTKSWDALEKCLAKLRIVPRSLRTLPSAKLVMLEQQAPVVPVGAYLYVQHGSEWQLAGMTETVGWSFEALDLATMTIASRTAYRFDYGVEMPTSVQLGAMPVAGLLRMTRSMYCSGDQVYQCAEITMACELLVRGRALLAFHGAVSIARGDVTVTGDQRRAGRVCAGATQIHLPWVNQGPV